MAKLANIYDAIDPGDAGGDGGGRGADLRVTVEVPRAALGSDEAFFADVPLTVDGQRRADPHGDGAKVPLNLPASVPEGATLRLRGLGALGPGAPAAEGIKRAGDLYVRLTVVNGPWRPENRQNGRGGHAEPSWLPWAIGAGFLLLVVVLFLAWH
jgi:hypothetical protein